MDILPEWHEDAVGLAQSGRRFDHTASCNMSQECSDTGCICGADTANKVLDRVAAPAPSAKSREESIGLVLPNEMLAHLNLKEGQQIFAIQCPAGYIITALDPAVREQVEIGSVFMDSYRDTFSALAKS